MTMPNTRENNPKLFSNFFESTLGLFLDQGAYGVFGFGKITELGLDTPLAPTGERRLIVVLRGCAVNGSEWYGPGNHFEQNAQVVTPLKGPATLWTLSLDSPAWANRSNLALRRALLQALIAADAAEAAATPPVDLPDPHTLCDVDHPEIRRRAARLRRTTQVGTAQAILQFVNDMPYRFGTWQERASDTLARGIGMCTTKANLQVALMRASGLEAGFVEVPMSTAVLGKLMPEAWLVMQRETIRHYFAAVKLDGVWHGCDGSYDPASVQIFLEEMPHMSHCLTPTLEIGKPYAPALEITEGASVFDIDVRPEITEAMGKKSRFLPRHFEALNTSMDRARGTHKTWSAALGDALTMTDEVTA